MEAAPRIVFWVLALAAIALLAHPALAATIRVPSQAPTIQAGINMAQPGDSVVVSPGTYLENLSMVDQIVLTGEGDPTSTIVDGRFLGPVVNCVDDDLFEIHRLTLQRGRNAVYPGGSGISMDLSSGTITNCVFRESSAARDGGGIGMADSNAELRDCLIIDNTTQGVLDGGGVFCWRSTIELERCVITQNSADEGGGILITEHSSAVIRQCLIYANTSTNLGIGGGGLFFINSSGLIENNTFVDNIAGAPTSASVGLANTGVTFNRNIIANANGHGLVCFQGQFATVGCNDVWNSNSNDYQGCNLSPTNFSADPLFCNAPMADYTIGENSPCAAANSPAGCGLIGAFEVGCGVVAVEDGTWGEIKGRFHTPARKNQ